MKLTEQERENLRRAYYLERKSIRQLSRETKRTRDTIRRAIADGPPPSPLTAQKPQRPSPVFGPFRERVEELLLQNEQLPRKQRYTSHRIFEVIQSEGYEGCESRVRQVIGNWHQTHNCPQTFLPLAFDPGQDAQCDWGEAVVVIGGVRQTVQVFVMRLCYSRRTFIMAFPTQKQESFFYGHVKAFHHFGGVPARISYDNLATAVSLGSKDQEGKRKRRENRSFVTFRSYYLFDSHFCTPAQGHEKGQVEHGVGFARRNFLVPILTVASFEELNHYLLAQCLRDDQRRVHREAITIGQAWERERPSLRPLPPFEYECCEMTMVRLTPYSQATFETNRYSVPVNRSRKDVLLKAYPFHVDILDQTTLLAKHPRCYEREQDIFDPLHYLPLLEQRPGAFDYAKPIRQWQKLWPECYHQALRHLREKWPDGRGVQEFVRILQLHQDYPAMSIQGAIQQALSYGCLHLDGVFHCLQHDPSGLEVAEKMMSSKSLDLSDRPHLQSVGNQPIDLTRYERLLKQSW